MLCWNILRKDGYCDSSVDPASSKAILFLLSFIKNNLKYKKIFSIQQIFAPPLPPLVGTFLRALFVSSLPSSSHGVWWESILLQS